MRLVLVVRHPGGGIKTFFRYIYTHAAFRGTEIKLISAGGDLGSYLAPRLPSDRSLEVVEVQPRLGGIARAVRRALRDHTVQLLHSHGFTAGVASELGRLGRRTPHLMTAHDVFLPSQFTGWGGQLKRWGLEHVFRRIDAIHAVSQDGAANIREFMPRVPNQRVHPILHGVDVDRFARAEPEFVRQRYGLGSDARLIGFFGRFMAQKGFRTLVDAIAMLREQQRLPSQTYVMTFGWGGFIREDYAYLHALGLGDVFIQAPYADSPETAVAAMDTIAMPSRWEACGLLAMETLAAGVPLVATDCIGLREVLTGTPAEAVKPGDHGALAEALLSTLSEASRERFRAYAPQARERFAIDHPARALRELCGQIGDEVGGEERRCAD